MQPGWSRRVVDDALDRARHIGADPIEVLAALDQSDREKPYRQAAAFLGVPHSTDIAPFLSPLDANANADVDHLGGLRSVRGHIEGNEVLFLSPGLGHLRGLAERIGDDENLRRRLCIVSPATLDAAIAQTNPQLLAANASNGWRAVFRSPARISIFRAGCGRALSQPRLCWPRLL